MKIKAGKNQEENEDKENGEWRMKKRQRKKK